MRMAGWFFSKHLIPADYFLNNDLWTKHHLKAFAVDNGNNIMANILIVDDSVTDQKEIKKILEKNGHTVVTSDSGDEAIKLSKTEKPDLILMDVVMPGLNGFQATRQITKNPDTGHIPVILISSKNQETDRQWGMRQGARDYLVKPIADLQLIQTINGYLN